ncbi:MAG: DUF4349 domain-containing protein [Chloroflexota bacterium]
MKRQILGLIIFTLSAMVMVACGSRATQVMPEEAMFVGEEAFEFAPAAPAEAPRAEFSLNVGGEAQLPAGQERLIIRIGDMSIVVADTEEALDQIAAMAENGGGWVVSSNVFQSTASAKSGYIQIRVPAAGFQSVLDAIAGLAVEVTRLSTSGTDVTEEYVDLSARLGNLEATAARLRNFLDEARTVEEALAVNQELSRIEGEIESLKGRMQYLEQSSAFSSISVNVTPDELAQPVQIGTWRPTGVAKNAMEALITALQGMANAVIWFVIFILPILLLIAIPFVLLIWLIRRLRRRERKAEPQVSEPPVE